MTDVHRCNCIHLPTNVTLWYVVVVPCRTCLCFTWRCFLLFLPATPCANRPQWPWGSCRGLDEELKKKAELEKLLNLQKEMSNMSNRFNRWLSREDREGWKTLDVNDIHDIPAAPWFWCCMLQYASVIWICCYLGCTCFGPLTKEDPLLGERSKSNGCNIVINSKWPTTSRKVVCTCLHSCLYSFYLASP